MDYVRLGNSGLKVSRLCLGAMTYGTPEWRPWVLDEAASRPFVSRTIADCMIIRNKIYREWIVSDNMTITKQLGLDPHVLAMRAAKSNFDRGLLSLDIGESGRMLGQYPPEWDADVSLAHTELEADVLRWLHGHGLRFRLMYERQSYRDVTGAHVFWGGLAVGSSGGGKGLVAQHEEAAKVAGVEVRYGAEVTA